MEEVYLWEYESFIDVTERIPYFIEEVYNNCSLAQNNAILLTTKCQL
jgi:hypothetical protein